MTIHSTGEKILSSLAMTKQPNSRHCFGCGVDNACGLAMTFYESEPGHVMAEYTVPDQYQGYPGIVHGGIVFTMLDEVLGRVTMVGDHTMFTMTAKVEIRFRKPVPTGEPLQIQGRLERKRGRLYFASAELRLPDGSIAAETKGMLAEVPHQAFDAEQLEELGWKVYPD
jgi:acyl-coenzyme A thioesterase PaaI-like protein